jgi:ribosomal protein L37AE/L43A
VVLEVDDPSQKMQSRTGSGSDYTWNDTFTIEITSTSSEVLFEVWDQGQKIGKSDAFLGLAIVSVSELMVTNSQRHVVPLQGRPYEEDQVTGLLTVEFVLKDSRTVPNADTQPSVASSRPFIPNQTLSLAGQVKQVKKPSPTTIPDLLSGASNKDENMGNENCNPTLLRPPRTNITRPRSDPIDLRPEIIKRETVPETENINTIPDNPGVIDTSRGRKRTRTFFNTIKRKISGTRSLSGISNHLDAGQVRSVSQVRPNLTRTASSLSARLQDDSSSMSGMSGISNASAKTFVTEESSLVLETLENGLHHHYLVPIQVAKKGRFKKKGTKLHVYMDHIFVAQHMKLGSSCVACKRGIPLRMGKQAYVCRDCGIITHKPCHIKVESHCIQTSLPSMELEYYGDTDTKA